MRAALGTAGLLASLVLITGLGTDLHEVSWFIYYGWSPADVPVGQSVPDAPVWLGWVLVSAVALRWCRIAAVAAWLAFAGMLAEIVTGLMFATAQTGVWLFLAAVAASGLSLSPCSFRVIADIGRRRIFTVAAAVVFVLFAHLLGHHFTAIYAIAWIALAGAVAYAARPHTPAGFCALSMLAAPALSAIITMTATDVFAFNIYRTNLSWPVIGIFFYGAPALVLTLFTAVLHRRGASLD
ncbi:MAG: hypothetical protein DLM56_05595 [Pseudonocardiales bacterium]|nr:MAG: hypothetical protein DLM56_05595 [Pseudonocardiales bacterium]